ncbi:phage adaptor protein [Burkholderia multivorans]|uniref:phage adaptor protein n=1 Tax=Burkholderia multivorans TaxID=87883 RepID=UPI001C24C53C|nr:hypothetical protein [Burkholderia multivorans]ULR75124.1 virion-associated protein [Burkholderia phage JC1]MBU9386638.1 hypothetical protein [Burkholderia multivorans]MBU9437072.1 hypothetical protein [Burkholderia multivorans]MBU9606277.1 hypothetical protein [Burkholderia multivorans]MBU9624836.1 hypothetical protein [Burkholderia multivorans]
MTDLDEFLTKVLPFAPGCPEPTAFEHIRNAAIEFCEETRLWRFEDTFDLGDDPNVVCVPQGAVIHELERCDFNGQKLDPRSLDWLDDHCPAWRSDTNMLTGSPKWFTQICPDTVRVVPMPIERGRLRVWLRLKPSEDADQLPDFIAAQHRTVIACGALAAILMLPGQTFSDPNRAAYFQAKFDQALGRKSKLQATGQQRAPIRTKANFF